jgi:hypothetical protein
MITPKRRQELSLGALVIAGLAGLAGVVSLGWWLRKRHRR